MRNLNFGLSATALMAAAMFALAAPASATVYYPWCAQYSEHGPSGGGTNCGFETLAQCRATISGLGGICYENPAYPPRRAAPAPRHHKRRVRR